jgi:predicted DCC family thiol-disulfide oxidoreductase YuxK
MDSIILYIPKNEYYYKSDAVLQISKELSGAYSYLSMLSFLPKSLLNLIYDYVAKNRYHWYGKQESCMIPTQELQSKFLQ